MLQLYRSARLPKSSETSEVDTAKTSEVDSAKTSEVDTAKTSEVDTAKTSEVDPAKTWEGQFLSIETHSGREKNPLLMVLRQVYGKFTFMFY